MARGKDVHGGRPILRRGPEPATARLTVILVHGRGGNARDMLGLADEIRVDDVAYLAPEAAGSSWYPYSFLAPLDQNEPALGSALDVLDRLTAGLRAEGLPSGRIAMLGFSQGACLTLEYAARHPAAYAAIVGLSGGLIGPPGTPRDYPGSLAGARVFLGCSDVDPHIPLERVEESTMVLRRMGATVDERIYAGMGHTVSLDEVRAVTALLSP
jgi:predicted esterase